MDPDDSPEMVHRVAMYVGAMIEAQRCVKRSAELKRQGKLKAATAKARKFWDIMFDIERGTDMRLIDAAASELISHPPCGRRAH
jgi:hypothetical protein